MTKIYLDNNSTTALDPRVFKAMLEDLSGPPANPSSVHSFGQRARGLLNQARQKTARFFDVKSEEVFFTSGGTESVHLMIRSLAKKGHLITTAIEHSCLYKTVQSLETEGWSVDYLACGKWGAPLPEQVEQAIRSNTQAFIFSACNGETGVKIDMEEIATLAEKHQIPLLIDAVAFIGKEPFVMPKGVSAVSLSGHKFHAPKGVGALITRSHFKLKPMLLGGAQEMQKRAGTENLSGILGLSEALAILQNEQAAISETFFDLRSHLENQLLSRIADVYINGEGPRIANTLNAAFLGVEGESLLMHLDLAGIAVSHGSACSSGALEPSRVLTQMGIERKMARSSIRISLSRFNTREEIDYFADKIESIVNKLRGS
jgi:cysteine desulfurase